MKTDRLLFYFFLIVITSLNSSCKKDEGTGGQATIRGMVYVLNYNANFTSIINEYYAPKEDVYIIYGESGSTYHDKVDTHYDGSYEFRYLKKGTYSIYVYSKDSTTATGDPIIPVIKTVEITSKKETLIVEDLVIIE